MFSKISAAGPYLSSFLSHTTSLVKSTYDARSTIYKVSSFFVRGFDYIPVLVAKGPGKIAKEVTNISNCCTSKPIAEKKVKSLLSITQNIGDPELEDVKDLQSSSALFLPLQYANTALKLTARKAYYFISEKCFSRDLGKNMAARIQGFAEQLELASKGEAQQTELTRFKMGVESVLNERIKSENIPRFTWPTLAGYGLQTGLQTGVSFAGRFLAINFLASYLPFSSYFNPYYIRTIILLGFYTSLLIPNVEEELKNLKAPKKKLTILNDAINNIIINAESAFGINENKNDPENKITQLRRQLENYTKEEVIDNPFPSLKQEAKVKKSEEKQEEKILLKAQPEDKKTTSDKKSEVNETPPKLEKVPLDKSSESTPPVKPEGKKKYQPSYTYQQLKEDPNLCKTWGENIEIGTNSIKEVGDNKNNYLVPRIRTIETYLEMANSEKHWSLIAALGTLLDKTETLKTQSDLTAQFNESAGEEAEEVNEQSQENGKSLTETKSSCWPFSLFSCCRSKKEVQPIEINPSEKEEVVELNSTSPKNLNDGNNHSNMNETTVKLDRNELKYFEEYKKWRKEQEKALTPDRTTPSTPSFINGNGSSTTSFAEDTTNPKTAEKSGNNNNTESGQVTVKGKRKGKEKK